ncbi:hypothetical protein BBK14_11260 [Parafrankia soli]|uniref:Uncharacterized protein n=1 Tax=Parafrankia soli TaxID=2599596 RepID=A0A1S1RAA8_9ACTN|nr:hypothetical protein [Parafrankia soli]OHV42192.1 hypothetical protein BBK14_11260 [Parafrankia soli]
MVSIAHHLNRILSVYRPSTTDDGYGGQDVSLDLVAGDLPAKVDQPGAAEQEIAAQWGATITHVGYVLPGADVLRGDELRGDDGYGVIEVFRVQYAIRPSQPRYLKLGLFRRQAEPANEVS